ncbi:MAG: non-canonical purine NTP pyrophosphatase, partial [Planctomycetota bacterium]
GYDPLVLVGPEFERTGAELASAEKNRISHRALAGAAMAARLRDLVG